VSGVKSGGVAVVFLIISVVCNLHKKNVLACASILNK